MSRFIAWLLAIFGPVAFVLTKYGKAIYAVVGVGGLADDLDVWRDWLSAAAEYLPWLFLCLGGVGVYYLLFGDQGVKTTKLLPKKKWFVTRPARRDASLSVGVAYLVMHKWFQSSDEIHGAMDGDVMVDAPHALLQAALDGAIRVWGKPDNSDLYHEIDSGFWRENRFGRAFPLKERDDSTVGTGPKFRDLMISRTEIEKINWEDFRERLRAKKT